MAIIYTILIFGLVIFIHELGHFLVARLCGVRVTEFALGMGPAIFKKQGKETLYSLRIFPIGGYAAMESEHEESVSDRSFGSKSVAKRVAICAAGAFMNLILGFVIIACTFIGVDRYASTTIAEFKPNAISNVQLQEGDKIVKINTTSILTDRDIVFEATRDEDGVFDMTVVRNGEKVKLNDVKFTINTLEDGQKSIFLDFAVKGIDAGFFTGIATAFKDTISLARNSWSSIGDLVSGKIGLMELSGPIGVGEVIGQAAKQGFSALVSITAFITISIGMFNLLPFPALDGGRIVIYIIEAIRRKPIPQKVEGYINAAGLILLFGLMIVITLKDIFKLF